ncbi:MAG: hypothetical protein OJF55_000892 [Rhodanobacteraceae bacterium]|nr:MAG: hypothetical protein OJF55_000892 [Rhodanobacteraceae bacterium]
MDGIASAGRTSKWPGPAFAAPYCSRCVPADVNAVPIKPLRGILHATPTRQRP